MAGIDAINTYDPDEIRGAGSRNYLVIPCTIEEGQEISAGTVIGVVPSSGKYAAYDDDGAASATSPGAGGENTGDGNCSAVTVDDDKTLTEDWTLTCTSEAENSGEFSVIGSLSGNVGTASVGSEFSDSAGKITLTISDGNEDFDEGDTFTFSTTRAEPRTALGILSEKVDASEGDVISSMYVKGNFIESKLTGLDSNAKTDLLGRSAGEYFIM